MKNKPTLVLVADGNQARLLTHSQQHHEVLWRISSSDAAAHTADLVSDKPGMSFSSAGYGRHAMTPKISAQRAAQMKFAKRVAEAMEKSTALADFEKLVMIAPPRALGDLRGELSERVRASVTSEVNKDLAGLTDRDVLAHLAAAEPTGRL